MLSEKDLNQLKKDGISVQVAEKQLAAMQLPFPYLKLDRACDLQDGIKKIEEVEEYLTKYEEASQNNKILKFVPASGAATRMFSELLEYIHHDKNYQKAKKLVDHLPQFAFFQQLQKFIEPKATPKETIEYLLTEKGLNYAQLPKALLLFHQYQNESRTAFEEHLVEAFEYAKYQDTCTIHFTISEDHQSLFLEECKTKIPLWQDKLQCEFAVDFSVQNTATQALSIDKNNQFIRKENGELLLRPGGHGALLGNLDGLDSDIVQIKNIDNVACDTWKKDTLVWKKVLIGLFYDIQKKCFAYIEDLQNNPHRKIIAQVINFVKTSLFLNISLETSAQELIAILDRPLRVCGVVENTGEPGGGPFWVCDENNNKSCQIVEKAQINFSESSQEKIFKQAKYFNPVDLVCGLRNYQGKKFNLHKFANEKTFILVEKSYNGSKLKSIELPGLWNGSMYYWNTVFVAVPSATFHPVKTIFDLLRREHLQ